MHSLLPAEWVIETVHRKLAANSGRCRKLVGQGDVAHRKIRRVDVPNTQLLSGKQLAGSFPADRTYQQTERIARPDRHTAGLEHRAVEIVRFARGAAIRLIGFG